MFSLVTPEAEPYNYLRDRIVNAGLNTQSEEALGLAPSTLGPEQQAVWAEVIEAVSPDRLPPSRRSWLELICYIVVRLRAGDTTQEISDQLTWLLAQADLTFTAGNKVCRAKTNHKSELAGAPVEDRL